MKQERINYYLSTGLKGNELKTLMQNDLITQWLLPPFNGSGYILAATGFGKGHMIELIHQRINQSKMSEEPIVTVVPRIPLKNDIDKMIKKNDFKNCFSYVINSFTMSNLKNIVRDCGVFIVDELQHSCNNESQYFSTCLNVMDYKYGLGLTATLEDKHREFLKEKGWNCVEEITIPDLEQLDLVPNFNEYNVGIPLSSAELDEYLINTHIFKHQCSTFEAIAGNNMFALGMACSTNDRKTKSIFVNGSYRCLNHYGWVNYVANHLNISNVEVTKRASMWRNSMQKRDSILAKSLNKQVAVKKICKELVDEKILIFAPKDIPLADVIGESVNGLVYHSKVKNRNGNEKKKIKGVIQRFDEGENRVLVSILALDEGVNVKTITCCINMSYSSKELQKTQRFGRSLRLDETNANKTATMINLYSIIDVPNVDSQDQNKLERAQKNSIGVEWVTFDELIWKMKNKSQSF